METNKVSALDLRKRFGEVLDRVRYRKEPLIITKNGRPMIVMIDIELYRASQDHLRDEAFIEEYSEDRIREFMKEDALDASQASTLRAKLSQ